MTFSNFSSEKFLVKSMKRTTLVHRIHYQPILVATFTNLTLKKTLHNWVVEINIITIRKNRQNIQI